MTLCIIQAREKSTRLPSKVLLEVQGKTILQHVYDRCCLSKADKVVIAIPKDDKKLEKLCIDKKMNYFLGDELDVLDRYYQCAKKHGADNIIRITSDCACIDYQLINECIDRFMSTDIDFITNAWLGKERLPDGMDVAIITFEYLEFIHTYAKGEDREHVLTYAMKYIDYSFITQIIDCSHDLSQYRLCIDYPEDWELIKLLYNHLYNAKNQWYAGMNMKNIISFLEKYPEFIKINSKYARNESYYKQLKDKNV